VDLPIDEPDAGIGRYAEVVVQAIEGRERVVVVAHSLSGLVAPVVAERVDALGIVMLAALWPEPGRSPREQAREVPGIYTENYRSAHLVRHDDGSTAMTNEAAIPRRRWRRARDFARSTGGCGPSHPPSGPGPGFPSPGSPAEAIACSAAKGCNGERRGSRLR
jgi:hypothetical protein